MKKLIELGAAIDAVHRNYDTILDFRSDGETVANSVEDILSELPVVDAPTVDAAPVAHSEWIPKEKADTPYGLEMECAKCGFSVIVNDALYFNFCPNCGAKMDGKEDRSHEQRGEKAQKGTGAGAPEAEDQGAGAQL